MSRPPACWTPPDALPALPPGEAVREWPVEVYGAPARFPPPAAPGFQRAWQLGLLPPAPPTTPPAPLPGLSSWDRVRLALLLCFGGMGLGLLISNGMDLGGGPSFLLTALPFTAGVALFLSTGRRDEQEFAAGYTSGAAHTGLWRIARDGRVLREPDRQVPPPGWYPSPYYPGVLQRWDGPGWKPMTQFWWNWERSWFRRPDRPFL